MKCTKVRNYRVITLALLLGLSLVGLSLMLARPPVVRAGTITVTSDADDGPGTLRRAILDAFPNDTINFAPGLTTINLTTSELLIKKNLTISGPGANVLTVQRSFFGPIPNFRIFHILSSASSVNVTLSGLTITDGNGGGGGGILNDGGSLTLTGCAISTNTAELGGGIFNSLPSIGSTITITNCSISGNTATGRFNGGGGIVNAIGGMVTITNSTISDNSTNQATLGGGIENFDTVNLINSTISGNAAADGGGIYNFNNGPVNLTNCTISNNSANLAAASGGINNLGTVNARNTIIARNKNPGNGSGADFKGTLLSQGFNLIGNSSGAIITGDNSGNQTNVDPNLGQLADNGGPTQTQALLPGSPAIDKGAAATSITTDQRLATSI